MKEPWEWEESDLLDMIKNKNKESVSLDYKKSDALQKNGKKNNEKKDEISKDVSAFANSAGGVIIYGISEDQYLPVDIDNGCDPNDITKEWLEQIINSRIHPKIVGLRINQVDLKTKSIGRVAYVVYVPQSATAHMASDHKYYKRYNFESAPMEDYEVKDIMRRAETPDISVEFEFAEYSRSHMPKDRTKGRLCGCITNESIVPAEYVRIILYCDLPVEIYGCLESGLVEDSGVLEYNKRFFQVHIFSQNRSVPTYLPIWKGMRLPIFDSTLHLAVPETPDFPYFFGYEIHCPGMLPKTVARQVEYNPSYGVRFTDKIEYLQSPFKLIGSTSWPGTVDFSRRSERSR